jgi:hypothetical protein
MATVVAANVPEATRLPVATTQSPTVIELEGTFSISWMIVAESMITDTGPN